MVRLVEGDTSEIELDELVFFNLDKDEALTFSLAGDKDTSADEKVHIIPKRKDELELSRAECPAKDDCQFTVTAKQATKNMLLVSIRDFSATMIK